MFVRRLIPDDAPGYRALMLDAYRDHPDAFTSSHPERAAQPADWWAWRLAPGENASQRVFGAFEGEQLIGAGGWKRSDGTKVAHRAELFGMAVAPAARGRGAGREIVRAILADARAAGLVTIVLTHTEGNEAAERLYAGCGFVRTGMEPMAVRVGNHWVAKASMWRRLDASEPAPDTGTSDAHRR